MIRHINMTRQTIIKRRAKALTSNNKGLDLFQHENRRFSLIEVELTFQSK
jgi:hypothetical protein